MNKKLKAFLLGVAFGLMLCFVYIGWVSFTQEPVIISPIPDEVQRSENVRQNYIRGMTQPLEEPQP